jgi:PAS domain S-box-containing protein
METAQRHNMRYSTQAAVVEKKIADPDPNEFLCLVAEAVPDMLLVYDIPSRACAYANRQVSTSLGFSQQEIEHMDMSLFERLVHPEDLASFSNEFVRFASDVDDEVRETEYRFRHTNGEWLWFHCRATVLSRDYDGLPRQILCAARDVTQHRRYKEAIREEEVQAAVNRLAARLVHDINNPLANIKNALFLLRNALVPGHPDAKYLQWSEEEVDRIAQTVRRVPASSQVDL